MMNSNLKVSLILIITILFGLVLPFLFLGMTLLTCPNLESLKDISRIYSQCAGINFGTIGLIITALPGIIISILFVLINDKLLETTGMPIPIIGRLPTEWQLLFVVIFSALANIFAYWLLIRYLLRVIRIIKKTKSDSKQIIQI